MKEEKTFDNSNATINGMQLAILKTNFPQCFDKNGDFILDKMQEIVSKDGINLSKESYSLNWLGKSYARLLANETPLTLLNADTGHNQKSENINSENLLIKGDNLEVLKHLRHAYSEQVKMIYIDPPYNTGNDGFVYADNRKFTVEQLQKLAGIDEDEAQRILDFTNSNSNSHSAWLTFIYPRLYIARELLSDDGVIFISIDDNEQAQLKMLCDEVFGEDNFLYTLSVINSLNGNDNSSGLMETEEFCFIYAKNKNLFEFGVLKIDDERELKKWQKDEIGFWKKGGSIKATGEDADRDARPNLYFPIFINSTKTGLSLEKTNEFNIEVLPMLESGKEGRWTWNKEKFIQDRNEVIILESKNRYTLYKKQRPALGDLPSLRGKETFYSPKYSTGTSSVVIKDLFGAKVFQYTKSPYLIIDLIRLSNSKSNDLILDFFAGSGTTADAVMQLNAEDGDNRKCISVQLAEPIDEVKNKTAYDFVKDKLGKLNPTIFDITKERILRASAKIQKDNKDSKEPKDLSKQDFGFKVFETLPMFDGYFDAMDEFNTQQELFDGYGLSADELQMLLTSMMVNDGIKLTAKTAKITLDKYQCYYAAGSLYLMDKGFTTDDLKALLEKLDNDEDFKPNKIILFGYNFDSKPQRETSEALNSYINKKQIELDMVIRY